MGEVIAISKVLMLEASPAILSILEEGNGCLVQKLLFQPY